MAIELMYNEAVEVKRLSTVVGTNQKEYAQHIANIDCYIQPLDAAITQDLPGSFGKDFLLYCPVADIQEGDRIVRDGSKEYRVTGVDKLQFLRQNDHMEVSIRIFEA